MTQLRPIARNLVRPIVLVAGATLLIEVLLPGLLAGLAGTRS